MPRQLDLTPGNLKVNNNPNVQLAVTGNQINSLFTEFGNLAELTFEAIVALIDQLFDYIDQATGLNLKALADLFAQLDFSSPSAFIASLVPFLTQLPEVLVELLISLIEQLIDPANSTLLQNLMEAAIQLLMSLPQLIEALFAPLINMFMSFLSGGLLTTGSMSDMSSMLGNIPLIGPFLEALTGSALTGGGSQGGFNSFFGDLTGLLGLFGGSAGLGTGNPVLSAVGDIPILGPLIEEFISIFTGGLGGAGGLTGIDGLGSVFDDFLGLFGAPTGLGSGTPTLPGIGSIPILGELLNTMIGGFTSGGITSGGGGTLTQVFDDFMGILGNPAGIGTGSPTVPATTDIPLFGNMLDLIEAIPGAAQSVIDTIVNTFLGGGGTGYGTDDLLQALTSIPAELLTGTLGAGLISNAGVGGVSNQTPELLTNPNFDTATSILGQGMWIFDGTQGPPGVTTSVHTTANGTLRELDSNKIAVATGQTLAISGNAKWSGFTGAANSIALTVAKFDTTGLLLGYDTIGSIASPGSAGGWTQLSNPAYTVPSGVASVQLRPVVTAAATAGTVWFGKLSVKQTGTTLSNPLVPLLDASKIGSGQFAQSFVSGLTTMFGGLSSGASIPSQLGISNIFDLQTLTDQLTNALIGAGGLFSGSTIPQARGSMDSIFGNLLSNTSTLQALVNAQSTTGVNINIDFSNYPNGPLPSMFTVTYIGPGTSTIGITSQLAGWSTLVNDADRTANVIYNGGPTDTDYQVVKGTLGSLPANNGSIQPYLYALCRVDNPNNPQNYVWARAYALGFLSYKADIGCTVAGVETVWQSGIALSLNYDITVKAGVGGNPRRYQAYSGTTLVYDAIEPGTASQIGAGFRYWGCRNQMRKTGAGAYTGGAIASTSVSDGS